MNAAAIAAVEAGVGVYYATPDAWLKVLVGIGTGVVAYLSLGALQAALAGRRRPAYEV